MSAELLKKKYAPNKKIDSFYTQRFAQVTNDGEHIYCQCSDRVNIVELSSGDVIQKIEHEEDEITSISLSPNNCSLAIGFNSSSVKHYEIKGTKEESGMLEPNLLTSFRSYHRGPVLSLCWDSSSVLLATGSTDGSARVWDLKQKFCTHSLKEAQGIIRVLMFDSNLRDRPWIFGAAEENIFIWQLESGNSKLIAKLTGHNSAVTAFQLSHSRERLISCGLDKVIIEWDLKEFTSKRIIPVFESLSGIVLKPPDCNFSGISGEIGEDSIVFTIGNSGTPRIWNVNKGKELWKSHEPIIPSYEKEILLFTSVAFSHRLNSFVLTTHDNNIMFIRCDTMELWKQLIGHNDEILDIIFLGDGLSHTGVASNSYQIRIYDNSNKNCQLISGHTATVLALASHPTDNRIFGSSSHDNSARIWRLTDTGSAECVAIATGHMHSVGCIILARDFLITGSRDTCVKKWNFSPKEFLSQNITKLSSVRTQKAHEKDINCVAISKNFKFVATASLDRTAKLWDSSSLDLLGTLQGHKKGVWCVQFSPTDCIVATASADSTIKLWNMADFSNVATFEGHEVSVLNVSWISKGLQLISSSADGLVKLWTVKDNLCVDTFDEHEGKVWALTVAGDGGQLVTGGIDSSLIWWNDVTAEEKEKEREEKQRLVEEEQMLLNLLQEKKWAKALRLSLRLQQPFRGLCIMKELLDHSPSELDVVLSRLSTKDLASLVEFAVQWNTKTKNMREAQSVITFLLKNRLPEELEELPQWQTALEGLLPYTERHLRRVSALNQSASIIHYMNSCISLDSLVLSNEGKTQTKMEEEERRLLRDIPKMKVDGDYVHVDSGMEVSEPDESVSENEEDEPDYSSSEEKYSKEDDESEGDDDFCTTPHRQSLPEDLKSNYVVEDIVASSSDSDDSHSYNDNDDDG